MTREKKIAKVKAKVDELKKAELPDSKMKFNRPMYLTDRNIPLYMPGKVYDVPGKMVERWLKRGGVIVKDEVKKVEVKKDTVWHTPPAKSVEAPSEKKEDVVKPPKVVAKK